MSKPTRAPRGWTLLVLLAGLAAWTPFAPAAPPDARASPSLELVSIDPLRIRGEHFRAYERVRVTASVDTRTLALRIRAGRRGGFTVRFQTSACDVTVRAVGNRGSRASFAFSHVICPPIG